jgi:predicted nucleic acid-binding protein
MTSSADAVCLPDVNVWIAAVSDRHEHHAAARHWFDSAFAPVCFRRVTQKLASVEACVAGRGWRWNY